MKKNFFRSDKGTLSMIRLLSFIVVCLGCVVCLGGMILMFFAFFTDKLEWTTSIIGVITTGGVSIAFAVISKAWQKKVENK